MSSLYYLGVGVCSLAISIYNFNTWSAKGNYQCYAETEMNQIEYKSFITSFPDKAIIPPHDFEVFPSIMIEVDKDNIYSIIALVLAIMYLLLLIMGLFLSCVVNSMSNQLPDDFIEIGAIKKFLACFCKILPPVFLLFSWINMILIIVIWILVATKECITAKSLEPGVIIIKDKFFKEVWILNIVNSAIWAFLHYGGSIIREMTYQEPFMYAPDTGTPNCCRTLMLKKLGP